MTRTVLLVVAVSALICGASAADVDDPVGRKLTSAKDDFGKASAKARVGLLADLKKKEEAAQKAGDLKGLEAVQAETKAFEDRGLLPKSVAAKSYESLMRTARAKLEDGYGAAVKQYTKDGKIALAKAVQQELDEFKKRGRVVAAAPADAFQVQSVWVRDNPRSAFTVTERNGEKFTATLAIGDMIERVVTGTIKDGKLSWLAKDVRAVRGDVGGDNLGTLGSDQTGDKIDIVWRDATGANGAFTLRLSKGN